MVPLEFWTFCHHFLKYRPWKIVVYLSSYCSEQMYELTILFNRFKIEHYNRTYPNIEFNILVGHCLHIKTYSWYSCDWLSEFKLVQYSCLVLRVNKYFFQNSMNINATKCNKEHCRNLFTVIGKLQIVHIKNILRIVRISLGLVHTSYRIPKYTYQAEKLTF